MKYKRGHFVGLGIAFGLPIGVPIGMILGNIAFGPLIGVILGLGIGLILEKTLNANPIPLTKEETNRQWKWSWIGVIIGLIVSAVSLILYFGLR